MHAGLAVSRWPSESRGPSKIRVSAQDSSASSFGVVLRLMSALARTRRRSSPYDVSPAGGERRASAAEDTVRQRHGRAMSRGACRRSRRSRPCASALSLAGDCLSNTVTQNRRRLPLMLPGDPRVRWPRLPSESFQSRHRRVCAGAAGHREAVARPPGKWQADPSGLDRIWTESKRPWAAAAGRRGRKSTELRACVCRLRHAHVLQPSLAAAFRTLRGASAPSAAAFKLLMGPAEDSSVWSRGRQLASRPRFRRGRKPAGHRRFLRAGGPRTGIDSAGSAAFGTGGGQFKRAGLQSRAPQTREAGRAQAGPQRRPVRVAAVQAKAVAAAALSWRKGPRRGIAVALAVRGRHVRGQQVTGGPESGGFALPVLPGGHGSHSKQRMVKCF